MLFAYTQALVHIDVEDLEVDATPEDLMLSYVSGEKGKVGAPASLLVLLPWHEGLSTASLPHRVSITGSCFPHGLRCNDLPLFLHCEG